jgi:hypothetical protein
MKQALGFLRRQTFSQTNQKEREKTQISKIRDENSPPISTDTTETQRIFREYFENVYSNLFENLE